MTTHRGASRWLLAILCFFAAAAASAEVKLLQPLSTSAWDLVEATPGIRLGGSPGRQANIQVVCDANCPYCAKLDRTLRRDYPDVAIRWVPIAYFKPDSSTLAAAILADADPAAALDRNYRDYDAVQRRGGYPAGPAQESLGPAHQSLKQEWRKWGGFTPMILVRGSDGRVSKAMGSGKEFLAAAIEEAAPAGRVYEQWRPARAKGD